MADNNISAYGTSITLVASKTIPQGFTFNAFAHDSDPFDIDSAEVADSGMGINGHMPHWTVCKFRNITIRSIASTDAANTFYELMKVNRAGYNKKPVDDTISITINYPDGAKGMYTNGIVIAGPLQPGAATAGNLKTPEFTFRFRDFEGYLPS